MITYLLLFTLGFFGVSLLAFWGVIRPPKIRLTTTPAQVNLPSQEVILTTADGIKLSAWWLEPPPKPDQATPPALILLHGYPAAKADMLDLARKLYPDFALLLVDLRYFGQSQGRYTTLGLKERLDVAAGLNFLASRGYQQFGAFGLSLGGATALLTAAVDPRLKAVASYAAFADITTLGYQTYRKLGVFKYPLVQLMLLWSELLFGESPRQITPRGAAEQLTIPVLIIHSQADEQIPFSHALALKAALSKNPRAEYYLLEQGLHGELPPDFYASVKTFFAKSL